MLISGLYFIGLCALSALLYVYIFKKEQGRYCLMGVSMIVSFILGVFFDNGREYEITLINQNKVKIKAMDSGRIYYCAPEKITETIDKDNL